MWFRLPVVKGELLLAVSVVVGTVQILILAGRSLHSREIPALCVTLGRHVLTSTGDVS